MVHLFESLNTPKISATEIYLLFLFTFIYLFRLQLESSHAGSAHDITDEKFRWDKDHKLRILPVLLVKLLTTRTL
jgi:hypothetical protein